MVAGENTLSLQDQLIKLEQELARHQEMIAHFQHIFQAIPDGVVCTDADRRILNVNHGMLSQFGYQEDELLGKRTDILYSSIEEFERLGHDKFNANAKIGNNPFETSCRKKDGTIFPAEIIAALVKNEAGEPICYIGLLRDISKRKKLENNLLEMEVKYRTIADFTYDWEYWINTDGSFNYVSPSCKRITGYSADEFMKNPSLYNDIILGEDLETWNKHYTESRKDAKLREVQFRILRRDGEIRWIEHACQPVIDDSGHLLGFRANNRDITIRKNQECELRQAFNRIQEYKDQLEAEAAYLREEVNLNKSHMEIVGNSNALQYVLFKIEQIAVTDATVLLLGETGTGKELFARAIHKHSHRSDRPLITLNCAVLSPELIESELFGHEKGAFTGASTRRIGRFELADNATLFLDEIGEMPLNLQSKLLRVIQEGEFQRLGDSQTLHIDSRIIAASNRDLEEDVRQGLFRQDLWYRLNIFPITAPPLRDRIEDIPLLVRHFVEYFAKKQRKTITSVPLPVINKLASYSWPGNVRELENVIERAVINTVGSKLNLAGDLQQTIETVPAVYPSLEKMGKDYITKILEKTDWKVSGKDSAAEILGLKRSTLRAKITKYQIKKS
jgi:PAS domain S-box-containing protein